MLPCRAKWLRFSISGCVLVQIAACNDINTDFFWTYAFASALTSSLVSVLYNAVLGGLTTATAVLAG
jgi:hypothetical protein